MRIINTHISKWKEVWINNSRFTPRGIFECSVRPEEWKELGWEPCLPSLDSTLLLDYEMNEVELSWQGNGKSETVTFTFSRRSVSITLDQTVALNEWNPVPSQHSKNSFRTKGGSQLTTLPGRKHNLVGGFYCCAISVKCD